jgi:hypothetical protein
VIESNADIVLIAELGATHLDYSGTAVQDWLGAFAELGLEWRVIEPWTGDLQIVELGELSTVESCNLVFARPSRLAAVIGSS